MIIRQYPLVGSRMHILNFNSNKYLLKATVTLMNYIASNKILIFRSPDGKHAYVRVENKIIEGTV